MGAACHTDAQQTFGFCKSEEPRTNKRDMEKMGLVQIRASPSFTYRSQSEAEMSDTEYINYTSHDEDCPKQDNNENNNNNNSNNENKNNNTNLIQHQTQIQSKNYNETENENMNIHKKKNEAQLLTPQTNTSVTDQLSLNSSRNSVIIGKDDRQDDANSIISSNRDRALSLDNNSVSGRSNRSSISNVSGIITNSNFQQLNMQNPPQCFPDTMQNMQNMQNGAIPPVTIPVVSTPTQFGMSLPMDSAMSSYHQSHFNYTLENLKQRTTPMMPSLPSLPSMPSTPSIQTRRSLPVNVATRDLEQFNNNNNNNNTNRNNRSRSARARPQSSGPRSNIMYFEPSPLQLSRANSRPLSSTSRHSISNINLNFTGTNVTNVSNVNRDPINNATPIPKSARRSFGSTSTNGNRSRSASRRRKKGHRHHRSHSELFKENESKEWSKRESKRLSKEMKSQLEILKTEIELLDKLDDGTISNQERETLEMISCKVALDHTA